MTREYKGRHKEDMMRARLRQRVKKVEEDRVKNEAKEVYKKIYADLEKFRNDDKEKVVIIEEVFYEKITAQERDKFFKKIYMSFRDISDALSDEERRVIKDHEIRFRMVSGFYEFQQGRWGDARHHYKMMKSLGALFAPNLEDLIMQDQIEGFIEAYDDEVGVDLQKRLDVAVQKASQGNDVRQRMKYSYKAISFAEWILYDAHKYGGSAGEKSKASGVIAKMYLNQAKVLKEFGRNYFKHFSVAYGDEAARQISQLALLKCVYADRRVIKKHLPHFKLNTDVSYEIADGLYKMRRGPDVSMDNLIASFCEASGHNYHLFATDPIYESTYLLENTADISGNLENCQAIIANLRGQKAARQFEINNRTLSTIRSPWAVILPVLLLLASLIALKYKDRIASYPRERKSRKEAVAKEREIQESMEAEQNERTALSSKAWSRRRKTGPRIQENTSANSGSIDSASSSKDHSASSSKANRVSEQKNQADAGFQKRLDVLIQCLELGPMLRVMEGDAEVAAKLEEVAQTREAKDSKSSSIKLLKKILQIQSDIQNGSTTNARTKHLSSRIGVIEREAFDMVQKRFLDQYGKLAKNKAIKLNSYSADVGFEQNWNLLMQQVEAAIKGVENSSPPDQTMGRKANKKPKKESKALPTAPMGFEITVANKSALLKEIEDARECLARLDAAGSCYPTKLRDYVYSAYIVRLTAAITELVTGNSKIKWMRGLGRRIQGLRLAFLYYPNFFGAGAERYSSEMLRNIVDALINAAEKVADGRKVKFNVKDPSRTDPGEINTSLELLSYLKTTPDAENVKHTLWMAISEFYQLQEDIRKIGNIEDPVVKSAAGYIFAVLTKNAAVIRNSGQALGPLERLQINHIPKIIRSIGLGARHISDSGPSDSKKMGDVLTKFFGALNARLQKEELHAAPSPSAASSPISPSPEDETSGASTVVAVVPSGGAAVSNVIAADTKRESKDAVVTTAASTSSTAAHHTVVKATVPPQSGPSHSGSSAQAQHNSTSAIISQLSGSGITNVSSPTTVVASPTTIDAESLVTQPEAAQLDNFTSGVSATMPQPSRFSVTRAGSTAFTVYASPPATSQARLPHSQVMPTGYPATSYVPSGWSDPRYAAPGYNYPMSTAFYPGYTQFYAPQQFHGVARGYPTGTYLASTQASYGVASGPGHMPSMGMFHNQPAYSGTSGTGYPGRAPNMMPRRRPRNAQPAQSTTNPSTGYTSAQPPR